MGWRLIVSATGVWNNHGFKYGVDNGAFTAYNKGNITPEGFDADKFMGVIEWTRTQEIKPDWVVVPDIVASRESLEFSTYWFPTVKEYTNHPLLAVQDGMEPQDAEPFIDQGAGIFLGGSTEYKLKTMAQWGKFCKARRCYYHVGRVNTNRRIRLCQLAGADSIDGTSVTKFPCTLRRIDSALMQPVLF